jgi:hypothetical protein
VGSPPQVLISVSTTSGGAILYTNDIETSTWTIIASGLSNNPFSFETFNSKVYMSNGVDNYRSWDGTTLVEFASAPKGKFLRLYKDTMWVSGITGTPDRVYSSAPGDPENFPVANWVDINKGDGDEVSGLASDGQFLVPFKTRRTFAIYDPVTFANRVVDIEKGCESHFSIISFEGQIFFLSRRGLCQYLGDSPSRFISFRIDPIFMQEVVDLTKLNRAYAYTTRARVGWVLPEVSTGLLSLQIEYYPRLIADEGGVGPFVFHRMPAQCFTRVRKGTTDRLYGGHNSAPKALWLFSDAGDDDGVPFQGMVETGAFDFQNGGITKYIRRMRFMGRGEFIVQLKRDFEGAVYRTHLVDLRGVADEWDVTDEWGTGIWSSGPTVAAEQAVNTDVYCRYLAFRLLDSSSEVSNRVLPVGSKEVNILGGSWAIYGILIDGVMLGLRS